MHVFLQGSYIIVDQLLRAGAGVDVTDDAGGTPLIAAAAQGRLEIVQRLLAAGADPRKPNAQGVAAYAAALARKHSLVAKRLLEAELGANFSPRRSPAKGSWNSSGAGSRRAEP